MQIRGGSKHGLFSYTLEEDIWKSSQRFCIQKKIDKEGNNVIYRLTGALTALPLTLVIGTTYTLKFLSISVAILFLSDLLLNEIKPWETVPKLVYLYELVYLSDSIAYPFQDNNIMFSSKQATTEYKKGCY